MGFIKTITTIDRKIWYLLTVIVIAIPLLSPLALPITVPSYARNVYDNIEALADDAVVYYYGTFVGAQQAETKDLTRAVIEHLFTKPNIRILFHSIGDVQGTIQVLQIADEVAADSALNPHGHVYGTDYVGLYRMPEEEATVFAFFANLYALVDIDVYDTNLQTMTVMQGINSYLDLDVILGNEAGSRIEQWVRIAVYHDMDMMFIGPTMSMPDALRYVGAGYVGTIGGMAGAAQYQTMLGRPGLALINMDCMSTTHILMLVGIVISNLGIIAEKLGVKVDEE